MNSKKISIATRSAATAKDDVTGTLIGLFKRLISEGSLVPGQRLPAERELAEHFGVSRSSLRQALKVLEIMGVISQRVGDGTYLNAAAPAILAEPMEFLILLDGLSFHELMETRLIVEPELAARAATRATLEDIAELQQVLTEMEESRQDHPRFTEYDLLFHKTIFRIAGNRVCSLMFTVVHQSLERLIHLTAQLVEPEHTLQMHRRIFLAIRRKDADEARRRMTEHLEDTREFFKRATSLHVQSSLPSRISVLKAAAHPTKKLTSEFQRKRKRS
ncbi:MAG: FadR/GntR family transcriptional regulator [Acidobacteriota bacterium]|nr:FadR/GntR family transcriptional regulator [Acidobacteriota bacterium]